MKSSKRNSAIQKPQLKSLAKKWNPPKSEWRKRSRNKPEATEITETVNYMHQLSKELVMMVSSLKRPSISCPRWTPRT